MSLSNGRYVDLTKVSVQPSAISSQQLGHNCMQDAQFWQLTEREDLGPYGTADS